jgi:hypothetical protein
MEKTAVEWLEEQTRKPEWHSLKRQDIFEQAKEMEKEQIIDAYRSGKINQLENSELYYNEAFKQK